MRNQLVACLTIAAASTASAQDVLIDSVRVREFPERARTISIRYAVVSSIGPRRFPPLFALQGGPGVSGTGMLRRFAADSLLRRGRDIVLIDQRGTPGSGSLSCAPAGELPGTRDALFPVGYTARCRELLGRDRDLASYTTAMSARDIDAVRASLRATSIDLYGLSYGTRLAQEYVRLFPQRVRRLILDGTVPHGTLITLEMPVHVDAALDRILGNCEASPDCARRHPHFRQRLEELRRAELKTTADTARRWKIAYALRGAMYARSDIVPAMIDAAFRPELSQQLLAVYAQRSEWVSSPRVGAGLHLTASCREDVAHVDSAAAVQAGRGTVMQALYFVEYRRACREWNVGEPIALEELAPQPTIPLLLFSGELDPVTPPLYAERVKRRFSRSVHVVFPGGGHGTPLACRSVVAQRFLGAQRPEKMSTNC